jgi:hypothetical protein
MSDVEACTDDISFTEKDDIGQEDKYSFEEHVTLEEEESEGQGEVNLITCDGKRKDGEETIESQQAVDSKEGNDVNKQGKEANGTTKHHPETKEEDPGLPKETEVTSGSSDNRHAKDEEEDVLQIYEDEEKSLSGCTADNKRTEITEQKANSQPATTTESKDLSPFTVIPSFLKPTLSLLAPKMNDVREAFPDSPASQRGIMMRITPNTQTNTFDSIFLYDDKEDNDDDRYDKRIKDLKSIPTLYRPTKSNMALPELKVEANSITKRGTMMKSEGIQFTSKFTLMVQNAQKSEMDNVRNNRKSPIPHDAFEGARSPVNKGHVFNTTPSSKKLSVPVEVFSECIKSPLKERMMKAAQLLNSEEKPPRVMKSPVPFEEFVPSPVRAPPVINEDKPIKSLKQLNRFMNNKVIIAEMNCAHIQEEWIGIVNSELQLEIDLLKTEWSREVRCVIYDLSAN